MNERRFDENNNFGAENNSNENGSVYRSTGEQLTDSIYRSIEEGADGAHGAQSNDSGYQSTGEYRSSGSYTTYGSSQSGSYGQDAGAYGPYNSTAHSSQTGSAYGTYTGSDSTSSQGQTSGSYTYQNNQRYEYNPYQGAQPKPKKKIKLNMNGFGGKLAKVAAVGLVFGLVAGVTFTGASALTGKLTGAENAVTGTEKALSRGTDKIGTTGTSSAVTVTDVSDVAENAMPAIVQVTCVTVTEYQNWFGQTFQDESQGAGSGIIMSKDDDYLYIATNNHVVSGAKDITITFNDDSAVEAEIQGTDPTNDLAVIKVRLKNIGDSTMDAIKIATIGSSDDLKVGDSAIVIGNALGYGQTVTAGVISATQRVVQNQSDNGTITTQSLIQTDAAINPGNSGGALLNIKGEVVGIVSSKLAATEVDSTGYAIPISQASDIITGLMNSEESKNENARGKGAYLGISGVDIDAATASTYNMPSGVYVSQVISGTSAQESGISKGDVITAMDGKKVTSMKEIQSAVNSKNPGDKMKVTLQHRDGNEYVEKEINCVLGERPEK